MDAVRKLNRKGFAMVYLALTMVVLVALVSLAVDLGYVYVAKGQLQNAADAAALAGATQLPDVALVRAEAKKFAQKNQAAGEQVVITDEDIVLGNYNTSWNAANPFRPNVTPYNAVQVTARRDVAGATGENQGKIHTFFGGIFALIGGGGTGWSEMGAAAAATATHPPRPSAGILLCDQWCNPASAVGTEVTLYWDINDATKAGLDGKYVAAFSEYSETKSTDFSEKSLIMQYIRGTLDSPVAAGMCGKRVYTTNGASGKALRALDERLTTEMTKTPGGWEVIAPLVLSSSGTCGHPDTEGSSPLEDRADESYTVTRFAKLLITEMDPKSHPYLKAQLTECIDCASIDSASGYFSSKLVKNNEDMSAGGKK